MSIVILSNGMQRVRGQGDWLQVRSGGAIPWWVAGGIVPATCVAAYQPKGAASLAASYINLANPGTNNAAPGVAPTLSGGWVFNGSTQYLTTGIVPVNDQTWSMFIQFSGGLNGTFAIAGEFNTNDNAFVIYPDNGNQSTYRNGGSLIQAGAFTAGNIGMAGQKGYRDGVATVGNISGPVGSNARAIVIGAVNASSVIQFWAGTIIALSVYSTTITAAQITALTTRMAAL